MSGHAIPGRDHRRLVVFVCLAFAPDSSATSILFTDLFRRMAARGARVLALTGFPTKDAGQARLLPRHDRIGSVEIERVGVRTEGKRHLTARAIAYGAFLLGAARRLARLERDALVLGGTDPPFTAIMLWMLWLVTRRRYQCILLDAYPDGLIALGTLRPDSLLVRVWTTLNRQAYIHADRIFVIGRDMIGLLEGTYRVPRDRIVYLPHWASQEVDDAEFRDNRELLESLGIADKFVVQYSGNMGLWHDMDTLVRAAAEVHADLHIHFLFIGKGRRRAAAERLAHDLKLSNITWLDFLPREQLSRSLVNCDVALISMRAGLEGVAVPSKLYGILAAGRPVLAQVPLRSEVAIAVREDDCGVVVAPGDASGLADAVRRLASDPDGARAMGLRARRAYETRYTIDHAVEAFAGIWGLSIDRPDAPE